ncbi:MAG: hypothetical protein BGP10_03080 [Rhodanobacter sp. 68-29]|nr:hypothetical protein [Rhodanobacter sp.]ODU75390.1 MAG: hypothetical protein ABT17_03920 [Rhodanobacter sp. SCN 69-32]OJY58614.1 MAG: hypothetical protein BGP10_03080 [Rhodanobacter sp. 68-29]
MRRILLLLAASAALLLAACAQNVRNDSLVATLNAYGSAVRWNGLESGLQFVDPEVLKAHPPTDFDLARYRQVRVSDYDDGSGPVALGSEKVQQTVRISFVNIHTQAERSIVAQQVWRYDEKAKHWWLESGLPDIDKH